MSVLMGDAKETVLSRHGIHLDNKDGLDELVYADDTLLLGVDADVLSKFMTCIGDAGREYGLCFNWKKLEALPVRMQGSIAKPDGSNVSMKPSMQYLGCVLSADGRLASELGRRIGEATRSFEALRRVWSHASISIRRKVKIFDSCVVSKLAYGLQSACLNQAERRRVDGFQARCLRQILRIPPSFVSRVSNDTVFERARAIRVSKQILLQQMVYFGHLARRGDSDPVKALIFAPGSFQPLPPPTCRRQGRPRASWVKTVHSECLKAAGSSESLSWYLQPTPEATRAWYCAARQHICI